jgi:hypothetical protein
LPCLIWGSWLTLELAKSFDILSEQHTNNSSQITSKQNSNYTWWLQYLCRQDLKNRFQENVTKTSYKNQDKVERSKPSALLMWLYTIHRTYFDFPDMNMNTCLNTVCALSERCLLIWLKKRGIIGFAGSENIFSNMRPIKPSQSLTWIIDSTKISLRENIIIHTK